MNQLLFGILNTCTVMDQYNHKVTCKWLGLVQHHFYLITLNTLLVYVTIIVIGSKISKEATLDILTHSTAIIRNCTNENCWFIFEQYAHIYNTFVRINLFFNCFTKFQNFFYIIRKFDYYLSFRSKLDCIRYQIK